jgi:hypothetical protein
VKLLSSGLWPLDLKVSSLQKIVTALPMVHVPVLESDNYPHSPFAGQTLGNDYGSYAIHMADPANLRFGGTVRSSQRSTDHSISPRPQEQPSQQTLESLAERIREHCAGLCLETNSAAYLTRHCGRLKPSFCPGQTLLTVPAADVATRSVPFCRGQREHQAQHGDGHLSKARRRRQTTTSRMG